MSISSDKEKALETAMSQVERQFGKGSIMKLGSQPVARVPIISTGSLALDGTLEIALIDGFTPDIGDTFDIMTFDSFSGDFDNYVGMSLGGGLTLNPEFTAGNTLKLTVVPEPCTIAMAVLGLLSLAFYARRRR